MSDGGPAFPQVDLKDSHGSLVPDRQAGMTLRDYFAAKAMQGLIGCADWREFMDDEETRLGHDPSTFTAISAYVIADEMLRVRNES